MNESCMASFRTQTGPDYARLVAIAVLEKDAVALAYVLGEADADASNGVTSMAASLAPVVEAALLELGYFKTEA